eukprot:COSAG02_NODE_8830_length_2429_cov_1.829614_2_plen_539_part_00
MTYCCSKMISSRAVFALHLLFLGGFVVLPTQGVEAAARRPEITVLGTLDLLLVETTPVTIDGELWLFESVRPDYWNNSLAGHEYLRFVHLQSGRSTAAFGLGHALGSAIVDTGRVFAFGTKRAFGLQGETAADGQVISVFWSSDGMKTWDNKTAIDFSKDTKVPGRSRRVVFNTSVGKGKLNGTDVYVLAYEWSRPGTPGGWNTNFAVSTDLLSWRLMPEEFSMPVGVEHADPTLRFSGGYWYCIPARKDPARWYFFQEIYRSTDLKHWESAPGMGSPTAVGQPLLQPVAARDKALAPRDWHPDLYETLKQAADSKIKGWEEWEDCNSSDMDLCEWNQTTILVFNWGCQHATEALGLAVSPMPLDEFLQSWFVPAASSSLLPTPVDERQHRAELSHGANFVVPHLSGIFLSINSAQATWSKQQWIDDLMAMKDVGIEFFCPRAAANGRSAPTKDCPFGEFTSFYPSKNSCFKPVLNMPEGGALATLLMAAQIVGLKVHLGLAWPSEAALQAVGGRPINGSYLLRSVLVQHPISTWLLA